MEKTENTNESKEKGQQMKINLYYTTTTSTNTNTNTKIGKTTPNEKQASSSSETPSIFHKKFESPPTRKRALQLEESTPESLHSESPIFLV